MAYLFPRVAFTPVRCAPIRHEFSPLFSLFNDATRELRQFEQVVRQTRKSFSPRFDVKEDKESYVLEGEVPGFQDSDLSIEWNNDVLAIRGQHQNVTESGNKAQAVEAQPEQAAVKESPASEASSIKSHQPTVEDEEPEASTSAPVEAAKTAPEANPSSASQAVAQNVQPEPEVQHWISERTSGQFLRQFSFPHNSVDHEAIKASLQSGILKIVVPKAAAPVSRSINIE